MTLATAWTTLGTSMSIAGWCGPRWRNPSAWHRREDVEDSRRDPARWERRDDTPDWLGREMGANCPGILTFLNSSVCDFVVLMSSPLAQRGCQFACNSVNNKGDIFTVFTGDTRVNFRTGNLRTCEPGWFVVPLFTPVISFGSKQVPAQTFAMPLRYAERHFRLFFSFSFLHC